MSVSRPVQPIIVDDAALSAALTEAHLPSLLPALAMVTGDYSLLRPDLRPNPAPFAGEQGGLTPEQQDTVRALALDALARFRDGGCKVAPPPDDAQLHAMVEFLTGGQASEEYVPLILEELAFPREDARAPRWHKDEVAPAVDFRVAIIGAGMSGILAGIRLNQAGVPFTIFEKNTNVGGTWFENTYPGARVDNPNHGYSYSFAQKTDWPFHFSPQAVLRDYFTACADEFGVRPYIRFETEVTSAAWDDAAGAWSLQLRGPGGAETVTAQAIISAVGQLNRPKMPDIDGMTSFEGPSFHSARWDHSASLKGKRVAVIGTGASASQFIPIIAEDAERVTVFQRTPGWYAPNPNYHAAVEPGLQWLFGHVPHYNQWYRFWLFWTSAEGLLPMAKVDPAWDKGETSVSAGNDEIRAMFTEYLTASFADRPDLLPKVIPNYPPAAKRIVIDNGVWPATLKRPNVTLVNDGIERISPRGVVAKNGAEYAADVIIYGTGFQASRFLTPMKLYGRGGVDLHQQWGGDARAFMGVTVPNFPNLFLLYGPNTNIVVNGSIVYFSECEVTYVMGCLKLLLETGHRAMDPTAEAHDAYNVRIDAGNRSMAWGVSKVNSWYKSDSGRVAQNWPFTLLEYWQQTREPKAEDYVFRS